MEIKDVIRLAAFNLDVHAKKQVLGVARGKLASMGLEPKGELKPLRKGEMTESPCAASHVVDFIERVVHPNDLTKPVSLAKGAEPTEYQRQHLLSANRAYDKSCKMQAENVAFLQRMAGTLEKSIGHATDIGDHPVDQDVVFQAGDPRVGRVNEKAEDPNPQRRATEKK